MDGLTTFLEAIRDHKLATAHLRGVIHILIGRKVTTTAGEAVSAGITWRDLAALLKELRFDKDLVRQLGAEPDVLAPRDRHRMWYSAIALARPDSIEAHAEADSLVGKLKGMGYVVGPAPNSPQKKQAAKPKATESAKKKK